jgi:hypothetical protein
LSSDPLPSLLESGRIFGSYCKIKAKHEHFRIQRVFHRFIILSLPISILLLILSGLFSADTAVSTTMATLLRRLSKSSSLGFSTAFKQQYHSSTQGSRFPIGASISAAISGGLAFYYFYSSPNIVLALLFWLFSVLEVLLSILNRRSAVWADWSDLRITRCAGFVMVDWSVSHSIYSFDHEWNCLSWRDIKCII